MGNHFCNCSEEYENYLKTIASTHFEVDKPFFWGVGADRASFLFFLEAATKKFVRAAVPSDVVLLPRSTGLYVNGDKILIAGGLNPHTQRISSFFYLYHIESQSFEKREDLPAPTFGAASTYFLQRFYLIGGSTYGPGAGSITSNCFEYNFNKRRWFTIAPLNVPRMDAQAFVYQNNIWVVGGRSPGGEGHSAEVFEPHLNRWTFVLRRLPFDYWQSVLMCFEANRICIMGGGSSDGPLRVIHHIDLQKKNIMSKGSLKHGRIDAKLLCNIDHKQMVLLGGGTGLPGEALSQNFQKTEAVSLGAAIDSFDFTQSSQNQRQVCVKNEDPAYKLKKNSVEMVDNVAHRSYKSRSTQSNRSDEDRNFLRDFGDNTSVELHDSPQLDPMDIDSLNGSRDSLVMHSLPLAKFQPQKSDNEPEEFRKCSKKFEICLDRADSKGDMRLTMVGIGSSPSRRISKRNYIFGTDEHPFYLFMDKENFECKLKPIPLELALYSEQGAIRINDFEVLFCGGRSFTGSRAVRESHFYNLREKQVKVLSKMATARFGISFCLFKSQVWVVGGKTVRDGCVDTLGSVEVFDVDSLLWSEHPARLLQPRSHSVCFVLGGNIYCAGGIGDGGAVVDSIERFHPHLNQWTNIDARLHGAWKGLSVYKYCPAGVIIFGGDAAFKVSAAPENAQAGPLEIVRTPSPYVRQAGTKVADMRIGFLVFDDLNSEFVFHGSNTLPEKAGVDEENIVLQMKAVLGRVFTHDTSMSACSLVRPFKQTHFL